jgi:hypothetical protein
MGNRLLDWNCESCRSVGLMEFQVFAGVWAIVPCPICKGKGRHGWKGLPLKMVQRFASDPKFNFSLSGV